MKKMVNNYSSGTKYSDATVAGILAFMVCFLFGALCGLTVSAVGFITMLIAGG